MHPGIDDKVVTRVVMLTVMVHCTIMVKRMILVKPGRAGWD